MGSPEFALPSFEALLNHSDLEVVGVISQPDRPSGRKMQLQPTAVKVRAQELGFTVLTPETVNTEAFRQKVASLRADIGVVVAFGQILGQKFLDLFPKGCVNVHASLLPRWRGAAPIQRAIMEQDKETGVALQTVVKKLDAGGIIAEGKMTLDSHVNSINLHDRLAKMGGVLLSQHLISFLRGEINPKTQDESFVTYAKKIEKSEAKIDVNTSAASIHAKILGLAMGPLPYVEYQGKMLKLLQTEPLMAGAGELSEFHTFENGRVLRVDKDSFDMKCGEGRLRVFEVQPESKNKMPVEAFLRGYNLKEGDRLG